MPVDMNEVAGRKPIHGKAEKRPQENIMPTSTVKQNKAERQKCPKCENNAVLRKNCVVCAT